MNCQETQKLVHGYHDGELDAANALAFERHLADCPACFGLARNLDILRHRLRDESLRHRAPAELRRSVRAALASGAATEKDTAAFSARPWRVGIALAAAAALLAVAFQWFSPLASRRTSAEDLLVADLTSSHVRSLMANHLEDVPSTDQHTVKPWFDGKLDFAPPVKDFREAGYPLVGGRLDYISERPVAALIFGRQKHWINLFIWPAESAPVSAPKALERKGYHLVHWDSGGMAFWAVSDLNEKELLVFANLWNG